MAPIRILIVEDNPLQRLAMQHILEDEPDFVMLKALAHGRELLPYASQAKFEVLVMDLLMQTGAFDPYSTLQTFRLRYPEVKILVVSSVEDDLLVQNILSLGVHGYIFKSDELVLTLPRLIREVYWGGSVFSQALEVHNSISPDEVGLTAEELATLSLLALGYTNEQIGEAMHLAEKTVRNHLTAIYRKLQVPEALNRRTAAVKKAQSLGLIP